MAELPERLRAAADAHRPDRERMLARVERAIAAPEAEPAAPWMRVGVVAAAVAGAIGLGGLAVGAVSSGSDRPTATTQAPAPLRPPAGRSPEPSISAPPSRTRATGGAEGRTAEPGGSSAAEPGGRHSRTAAGSPASPASPAGATPGADGASPSVAAAGPVRASGGMDPNSNPYWAGSDVRLTTAEQLASFTVEIRISAGSGPVTSTNSFTDIPGGLPAVVSAQPDGSLLYRWTLTGRVLPPGTYTFGAQFNHPRGTRDTTADRWTVDASGAVGTAALPPLTGHF